MKYRFLQTKALRSLMVLGVALCGAVANAQLTVPVAGSSLSLKFGGRINMDLGTYLGADDDKANRNGFSINDSRLGITADFDTVWQAKMEIAYANKAIAFRDVYVRRAFKNGNELKIGNIFMPFGLKPGGLAYKFIETACPDQTFTPLRKLGLLYSRTTPKFNWAAGIYSDGSVDSKSTNSGYLLMAHALVRPIDAGGTILHIGTSAQWIHPSTTFSYSVIVPETFQAAKVASTPAFDAYNYGKFEAQVLYICRRFYAEAHYLHSWVNLPNEVTTTDSEGNSFTTPQDNYDAHGVYVQTSWRIFGDNQNYNRKTGIAGNPGGKAAEVLLRYAQTDLEAYGLVNDVTIGFNYFFNKYLRAKVNYAHSAVKDGRKYDMLQARLQFSF